MCPKLEIQLNVLSRAMNDIKKKQIPLLQMNNIASEMENTMDGINIRLDTTEEKISDLEDRTIELSKMNKERKMGETGGL